MSTTSRVLGVDPGSVRIGLALSDDLGCMAHPLKTLNVKDKQPPEIAFQIASIALEKQSPIIVLGLPRNMNGTYGLAAEKSRALALAIQALISAKIILWDERLTTVAASRRLQEAGKNSHYHRSIIDQAVAVQILQEWLDAQAFSRSL